MLLYKKMIIKALFLLILLISISFANVTQDLIKLSEMFKNGLLTQEERSIKKMVGLINFEIIV